MRILLAAKADVHASDAHDNDALTFAAGLGCGAVAVLLGVDAISIKNNPNNGTEELARRGRGARLRWLGAPRRPAFITKK